MAIQKSFKINLVIACAFFLSACHNPKVQTFSKGMPPLVTVKEDAQVLSLSNWGQGPEPKSLSEFDDFLPSQIQISTQLQKGTREGEALFIIEWTFQKPKVWEEPVVWFVQGEVLKDFDSPPIEKLDIPSSTSKEQTKHIQTVQRGKLYGFTLNYSGGFHPSGGRIIVTEVRSKRIYLDLRNQ